MKITVKVDNQTFDVNVGDLNTRPVIATIDGQTFEVYPEQVIKPAPSIASVPVASVPIASPMPAAASPALVTPASAGASSLKAPIPGVIITISVKDGDTIKKGQELCVLEAMKMKNSLKSPRDGKVTNVKAKVGEHVQKDAILIEIGD